MRRGRAAEMMEKAKENSAARWARLFLVEGGSNSISYEHRRWKATMFPFDQLTWRVCPLCGKGWSNIHLPIECKSPEIEEIREQEMQMMEVFIKDWEGHCISEKCSSNWLEQGRRDQIIHLIRAEFSPESLGFWRLVSKSLAAMWKKMSMVLMEREDPDDLPDE